MPGDLEQVQPQRLEARSGNITLDWPIEQEGGQMMSCCSMATLPPPPTLPMSQRHTSKPDTLVRGSNGKMPRE